MPAGSKFVSLVVEGRGVLGRLSGAFLLNFLNNLLNGTYNGREQVLGLHCIVPTRAHSTQKSISQTKKKLHLPKESFCMSLLSKYPHRISPPFSPQNIFTSSYKLIEVRWEVLNLEVFFNMREEIDIFNSNTKFEMMFPRMP